MDYSKMTQKQLNAEKRKIVNRLSDMELEEDKPKARAMVGKYRRYENSNGDGRKWWMYGKVIGLGKERTTFILRYFQKAPSSKNEIEIVTREESPRYFMTWQPSDKKTVQSAWKRLRAEIDEFEF